MKNYLYLLGFVFTSSILVSCGSGSGGTGSGGGNEYLVTATAGSGGSVNPASRNVDAGQMVTFTVTPDTGFVINSVSGCSGSLSGNTYTTGAINSNCTVSATFSSDFTVTATAGSGGSISPTSTDVPSGQVAVFTVTADPGYIIDSVAGCNGSLSSGTYTTGAITADCTVSATFQLNGGPNFVRESNTTCIAPDLSAGGSGSLSFEEAFPNLPVASGAISMAYVPGGNSWVLALREGRLVSFENSVSAASFSTILDIQSQVTVDLEFGLTGVAFHPSFPADNRLFVVYNDIGQSGRSTLSSFTVNTSTLQASNEQVLLTLPQPANNHNGGDIAFGPDGHLYVGFGDGGWDRNDAQDLSNLRGSFIRIDVSDTPYSVPSDNPFNTGQALCSEGSSAGGVCPEIYAYGFRNPWRWSFDRVTGDLWVGDVGENTFEEVDRVVSGGNYGWPTMEANTCLDGGSCDTTGLELPITQYGRGTGSSTVGGYVYRGSDIPELSGDYIFGDSYGADFLSVPADSGTGTTPTTLALTASMFLVNFEEDIDGEIYALSLGSTEVGRAIFKLTGSGSTAQIPENLSETGCFNPVSKTAPAGVIPYDVNSELWSDGANKTRYFALPDGEFIDRASDGDFEFPEGTILIKHFLAGNTYLETRLMYNFSTGWQGYSYEWNAGQTDAALVDGGTTIDTGSFDHSIPTRSQCFSCHTPAANFSLGLEAIQQNYFDDSLVANMLEYLNQTYFASSIDVSSTGALVSIDDTGASLEDRARSYLHSNCSGCHRDGGPASYMDLRFSTPLSETGACGVAAAYGDFGISGAERINPGNASESALLLRMEATDSERMPPLASLLEDTTATQVVEQWIDGLADCS